MGIRAALRSQFTSVAERCPVCKSVSLLGGRCLFGCGYQPRSGEHRTPKPPPRRP